MKGNGGARVKPSERVRGVSRFTLHPDLTHTLSDNNLVAHDLDGMVSSGWVLVCVSYASTGIDVSDDYTFKHPSSSLEDGNRRGHAVLVGSYRSDSKLDFQGDSNRRFVPGEIGEWPIEDGTSRELT